jgi:AcrR family transcriptional regulator
MEAMAADREMSEDWNTTAERIVDVATMLFWRDGYHAVSTDAICRAANVSKGSLYHAFPAKADIVAAALEQVWRRTWRELSEIYAGDAPIAQKFRAHLLWFSQSQRTLRDKYGLVVGTFDMALGVSAPEALLATMQAHQRVHYARMKDSFSEILNLDDGDEQAAWLTDLTSNLVAGSMIRARMRNDLAPLEDLPDSIFKLIEKVS